MVFLRLKNNVFLLTNEAFRARGGAKQVEQMVPNKYRTNQQQIIKRSTETTAKATQNGRQQNPKMEQSNAKHVEQTQSNKVFV